MTERPKWNKGTGNNYQSNSPGYNKSYQKPYKKDVNDSYFSDIIEKELEKIRNITHLSELNINEVTRENGIAETLAKSFKEDLNSNQLRKIFDTIISNQERLKNYGWEAIESDFYMIRPNLAYAKARNLIPEGFFLLVELCCKKIRVTDDLKQTIKNYDRFVELMQAIVAYNKYHKN